MAPNINGPAYDPARLLDEADPGSIACQINSVRVRFWNSLVLASSSC